MRRCSHAAVTPAPAGAATAPAPSGGRYDAHVTDLGRRPLMLAGAASALGACAAPRPHPADPTAAALPPVAALSPQAALDALVQDPHAPWLGVSALAVRNGQVIWQGHAGRRRVDAADPRNPAAGRPVNARTLYRMASVSKLVVAVAVLRLVEQGHLGLDEDVSRWLGWRLRHPEHPQQAVTLRLLMTHRAGLRDDAGYAFGADTALSDVLDSRADPSAWRPGQRPGASFAYCNLGWGVVATVMEAATGERFDRLMQALVFTPLGMRGGFDPTTWPAADLDDLATLYRKRRTDAGRETWDPAGPWVEQADAPGIPGMPLPGVAAYRPGTNGTLFGPQGRLRTGVGDLGVLMNALLAGGRHVGAPFLGGQWVRELGREQWRAGTHGADQTLGGALLSWGLGAQRFTDTWVDGRGDRLVEGGGLVGWGHLGTAYGLLSAFVLDPVNGCGLVTVLNGPSRDPYAERGRASSVTRAEERLLTAVWRQGLPA